MAGGIVEQLEAELHDQPYNPLRPNQREAYEKERKRLEAIARAPVWEAQDARGNAVKQYKEVSKVLAEQAPKKITDGERANRVNRLAKEVLDRVIRPALQPDPVMKKRPAGAVDRCLKGEMSRGYKRAALAWKRAMWAQDPDGGPDHTNLEQFRPQAMGGGPAAFMGDSEEGRPGYITYSHIPAEQWPFDPPSNTAVAQVAAREAVVAAPVAPIKVRKPMSPEARARASQNLALARAKRHAVAAAPVSPIPVADEGVPA